MKNKLKIYFLLIVYMTSFIFCIPSLTANTNWGWGTTFEDGIEFNHYTQTQFYTTGDLYVRTYLPHSGTKDIHSGSLEAGTQNFNYTLGHYLTSYFCWLQCEKQCDFLCYDSLYGTGTPIIFMGHGSNQSYWYKNNTGVNHVIMTSTNYVPFGFSIDNQSGYITYSVGNITMIGQARNMTAIKNNYRINRIYSTVDVLSWFQLDDLYFWVNDTYGNGTSPITEIYCGNDVSLYPVQIGNIYQISTFMQINSKKIQSDYNVPIDTTIHAVGLAVSNDQYIDDSNIAHYWLEINGVNESNPECFNPIYYSGQLYYILFWNVSIAIHNRTVNFIFTHSLNNINGKYWEIGQSQFSQDLDNDGDSIYYFDQSFSECHWEWIAFGGIYLPYYICTNDTMSYYNADLGMSFWSGYINNPHPPSFNDTLGLNSNQKNSTGYLYSFPNVLTTGVVLSYQMQSALDDYEIWVNYSNDSGWESCYYIGDFPENNPEFPDGTLSMTPLYYGKYEFDMYRNGVIVASIVAWVTGNVSQEDYAIYTNPPITWQYDSYYVFYRFNNPSSYTGYVTLFTDYQHYLETGFYAMDTGWNIPDYTNDSQIYQSTGSSTEYWGLWANKTGSMVLTIPLHQHLIRLYGITENKIWVLPTSLNISSYNVENRQVVIFYQHRYLGGNVWIYLNNNPLVKVGNNQSGTFSYIPRNSGYYTVSLRLNQNGTWENLGNAYFTVSIPNPSTNPNQNGSFFNLSPPYTYLFGAIITIVFIILPVVAVGKLGFTSDIMKYVPVFSGMVGFILSCLLGMFPWYSIFALILVLVLVIVVMWQSKKIAS